MSTEYKLVLLGANGVGKSAFATRYVAGHFIETYDPTYEDQFRKTVELDNHRYFLEILDTTLTASFTPMRELYMKNGDGFILMYSVTSTYSLDECSALRDDLIRLKTAANDPRIVVALVGNKCDLEDQREVTSEIGESRAHGWGFPFLETSAKDDININEVFINLIRQLNVVGPKVQKVENEHGRCVVM